MNGADPWAWPETAKAYVTFCRRHDRYERPARALARSLHLPACARVLDVAAGTGVTTRQLLSVLPADGTLVAAEPSSAMRAASGVSDPRLEWVDAVPDGLFDAVVCSAAVWLLGEVRAAVTDLATRIGDGGVLAFSIPAGFVGLPDGEPGDRADALNALVSAFIQARPRSPEPTVPLPDHAAIDGHLRELGLTPRHTEVTARWTFTTQRDWLRIPPVGLAMRPDLELAELEAAVTAAIEETALRRGHRTERWAIWTAVR